MRIEGILETALYVADVQRAADFYRRLFGFPTLLESERLIALNVAGRSVLLLFQAGGTSEPFAVPGGGGVIPPHGGSPGGYHFAFAIAAEDVEPWRARLESEGVPVESVVTWPTGAISVYFRDPDDNLAELITGGFWKMD
ncbi:VOC family protein [Paludisphaera rhizosphaerae]|uniref:VOC family protein n=1 Tax=Paludisphaera rhizosphaerae TaxID=2711216 RepID=UPI0013EC6761|nr:VOC family protein [Paludisphaera rhizosphaerae]